MADPTKTLMWKHRLRAAWRLLRGRPVAFRLKITTCSHCMNRQLLDVGEGGVVLQCAFIEEDHLSQLISAPIRFVGPQDQFQTNPGRKRF